MGDDIRRLVRIANANTLHSNIRIHHAQFWQMYDNMLILNGFYPVFEINRVYIYIYILFRHFWQSIKKRKNTIRYNGFVPYIYM